ncbi:hypothetical protein [Virgibacillus sediminis]|uniref:Copper resistance protein D domain-containing protein n=1 Tax=Virgibacillus sediminis TaxID=202260 RepID=A0ABV7A103_9BACI
MVVKLLNVSVVLLFGIGIATFIFAGVNPSAADQILTVPWINVSLKIFMFILLIASMTNFFRMQAKDEQAKLVHARNAFFTSVFIMVLVDWKNGWPVFSSFF